MSTKLGYLLPTREEVMNGNHGVQKLLQLAGTVEQMGFDSLWVGDSLFARPRHDPLTLLAALGAVTETVNLGTAVLLPALRNPVILAQQLATIDQISNGRLIVGVGIAGDTPRIRQEFEAASVPFEKRVGRLVEGMTLCRELWKDKPVDWNGRWQLDQVTVAPTPAHEGGPPIWLAAGVSAGIRRCARLFDGWMPIGPNVEVFEKGVLELRSAAEDHGRTCPTTSIYLTVCVSDDEQTAENQIDQYLTEYYGVPAELMRSVQACCGGSITKVMDYIESFASAGAEHIILRLVGDHEATLQQIAEHSGRNN